MSTRANSQKPEDKPFILGLDLGPDSIGWAIVDCNNLKPTGIRRLGVRRFEAGVIGNIEAGQDEAPGTARRAARQQRRQLWRRANRMKQVFRALVEMKLLPSSGMTPDERDATIKNLDKELTEQYLSSKEISDLDEKRRTWHLLPYLLRARSLEEKLSPFALGRALYHLAARRGYQSNLKAKKDEKEEGAVKSGIGELERLMEGRTLGEYFSTLDSENAKTKRIRERYTSRKMYLDEFEKIWEAQVQVNQYQEIFTAENKKKLHTAIFYQRPLKSQRGLVGMCEREPTQRRAPIASIIAQRFRMLQKVNDIILEMHDGELRPLSAPERTKLIATLSIDGDQTWAAIRKLLELKSPRGEFRGDRFNFEDGGDKKLIGNRSAAQLYKILDNFWTELTDQQQAELVDEILNFTNEDALAKRLKKVWKFSVEQSRAIADLAFEQGYASLSRRAMDKLLPDLETGIRLQTAIKNVYKVTGEVPTFEELPPVQPSRNPGVEEPNPAFTQLRNPTVSRALTELRKVVNAIIREHGKPARIHIELARDLKKSRKDRQDIQSRNKSNERAREQAAERLIDEFGPKYNRPGNILKLRLWDECKGVCPYTGNSISIDELIGDHPHYEIEHIFPFSWSLDNSYANKTLCHVDYNRNHKKNRTPFHAASNTTDWPEILNRVRRFQGNAAKEKLRRFMEERSQSDMQDQFTERQLSETRYISRLAADYLSLLYGGRYIPDEAIGRKQRIQVTNGQTTSYLRAEFKLNTLLGDPDDNEKSRDDHRHHAIDALVIALTSLGTIKQLSDSAERSSKISHRLFNSIPMPWKSLLEETRGQLEKIQISSRVNRKLAGQLHDATVFSKKHNYIDSKGKTAEVHHVRKPLVSMSMNEVEKIVDDRVREMVQAKLSELGLEPAKAFQNPEHYPKFTTKDGREIPIKRARIRKNDSSIQIGKGSAARYVAPRCK